jgi:hypothetical protein
MKERFVMLNFNNLYWEDKQNIDNIYGFAMELWGENVKFGDVNIKNSPYSEFELPLRLYDRVDVLLTYDRSIIGLALVSSNGLQWIDDLTTGTVFDGFESSNPENMQHNFRVLDEIVKQITALA